MEPVSGNPALHCQQCRNALLPGARFCTVCGSPVASLAQTPAPPSGNPTLQCQQCQNVLLPGTRFCTVCGSPVAGAAPAPARPAGPQKFSVWVPVKFLSVWILGFFLTLLEERDASLAHAFGFWIGIQLIPLLIALLAVVFRPDRKIRTFSTVFCCVALFAFAGMFVRDTLQHLARHEKTPEELVREAVGTKPIEKIGTPSDQALARVVRESMGDVIAARKKHDADAAALQPVLDTLYTAQSFENLQRMEDVIAAVRKIVQVDGELAAKFQRLPEETKAQVDASALSQQEKEGYVEGFQKAYGNSDVLAAWHDSESIEGQWATATIDLYTFASQHVSDIKTDAKHILIADQDLLDQFNTRFTASRDLQRKMDEANRRLDTIQSRNLQRLGINKTDLGLEK